MVCSAIGGAAFAGVSAFPNQPGWMLWASISLSLISSILCVLLMVAPLSTWEMNSQDLYRRWCDLRAEIDVLEYNVSDTPTAAQLGALKSLESKVQQLNSHERMPSARLIRKHYELEYRSRFPAKSAA